MLAQKPARKRVEQIVPVEGGLELLLSDPGIAVEGVAGTIDPSGALRRAAAVL